MDAATSSTRPRPAEPDPVGPPDCPVVDAGSPLFTQAAIGLGLADAEGAWQEVNAALCALTGRDRAVLRTVTLDEVTVPEDRHADLVLRRELLAGDRAAYDIEKRWRRPDGEEVHVRLTVSRAAVAGAPGGPSGPAGLLVQAQDVTAERRADQRARLLGDLVECSAEAIWARDGYGEVVYWNAAAARLLGYEAHEVVGRRRRDDVPASRLAETARVLARAAGGQRVGPLATVRRHKDGHEVDVSVTVTPMSAPDGSLAGFAWVARESAGPGAGGDAPR